MQLDQSCRLSIFGHQKFQGFTDLKHQFMILELLFQTVVQFDSLQISAPLLAQFPARVFDENPAHRFGGSGKKMSPAFPPQGLIRVDKPNIRLMHQSRRLQRMIRTLVGHPCGRQTSQLRVHQRKQLLGRIRIAVFNLAQNSGDVRHLSQSIASDLWIPVVRIAALRKQRDYASSDGLAIWLHTARAVTEPRIAPPVRQIWRLLSLAGPNADAMAEDLLQDAGLPVDSRRFVPKGFESEE